MSIALVFAFLLFVPVPAIASVKQGATCKNLGQTSIFAGKQYTCIKSGKKIVWNRGVILTKSRTGSSPSPSVSTSQAQPSTQTENETQTPISSTKPSNSESSKQNENSRKYLAWDYPNSNLEISNAAKKNFKSWLDSQSVGKDKILISINPTIDPIKLEYLTSVMKITSRTLLQNQDQITHMYISAGDAWVIREVKSDFPNLEKWSGEHVCYPPNPYAACAWPNYGIVFFISQNNSDWNIPNQGILQSGAHEFFHLVQDVLLRNSIGLNTGTLANNIPAWFYEGSATFIGTAYADESGLAKWNDLRADEIGAYFNGRGKNEPLESFSVNLVDRPQPEGQSHRPYGIGMLATEFIVASIGMENFLDIFRVLSTGKSFGEAFATSTGLGLEDFYFKFDSMRSQIGFFPVK